jgi:hypothetical protein
VSAMPLDDDVTVSVGPFASAVAQRAVKEIWRIVLAVSDRDGEHVALDALLTLYISLVSHVRGPRGCAALLRAFADRLDRLGS